MRDLEDIVKDLETPVDELSTLAYNARKNPRQYMTLSEYAKSVPISHYAAFLHMASVVIKDKNNQILVDFGEKSFSKTVGGLAIYEDITAIVRASGVAYSLVVVSRSNPKFVVTCSVGTSCVACIVTCDIVSKGDKFTLTELSISIP